MNVRFISREKNAATEVEPCRILSAGDRDFDETLRATSFNAADAGIRPDLIVQANGVEDVSTAVRRAGRENLRISVCSGGHSWSQNHIRQGGMLIDLSKLNMIELDATGRTAKVGPGCLSGDLDRALVRHDLFFPVAHAYTVGMGGFLLQGGFGWNSRINGPACESVVGVDLILANGEQVHASEGQNPELFWAARGAGPGFPGIVVRFHLKLHSRPRFTGLKVQIFRIRHMEEVVSWAHEVGPAVSPQVEFQMVFNRKAFGIFAHGIEVISPVLCDDRRQAKEFTAFIDESPLRRKASITLPIIPLALGRIMRAAEKVIFLPNTRWFTDNMWLSGPVDPLLPKLRDMVNDQPPAPSHALWMNWNPRTHERADMAFSLEAPTYLALYGGLRGRAGQPGDESWATRHARAMEEQSPGVQLADENLARRPARFMSPENMAKLHAVRARYDPDQRFRSYGHLA